MYILILTLSWKMSGKQIVIYKHLATIYLNGSLLHCNFPKEKMQDIKIAKYLIAGKHITFFGIYFQLLACHRAACHHFLL